MADPLQPIVQAAPRLWMGVRHEAYTPEAFKSKLGDVFIPGTAALMRPLGLLGYVPALLPLDKPAGLADEMALVVYPSVQDYKAAMATPVGSIYGSAHRDLFSKASTSIAVLNHDGLADPSANYLAEMSTDQVPQWSTDCVVSIAVQTPHALPSTWRGNWSALVKSPLEPVSALAHYAFWPQGASVLYAWLVLSAEASSAWPSSSERLIHAAPEHLGQALKWHWMSVARSVTPSTQIWAPRVPLPMAWGESLQMR